MTAPRSRLAPLIAVGVVAGLAIGTGLTFALQEMLGEGAVPPSAAPSNAPASSLDAGTTTPSDAASTTAAPTPSAQSVSFTIGYAGDVLTHMPVYDSAPDGDLSKLMAPFAAWTAGVDLALCGLEVPQSPAGWEVSGYPMFGMDPNVIPSLKSAGWDGCTTASNHSLDRGWEGVVTTLDATEAAGLGAAGTGRSEAEAAAPQLYQLERGGRTITVAQFASTYGTNGIPLPEQAPWSVVLNDTATMAERARAARAAGADVVVLQIQWGAEYVSEPTTEQRAQAQELADTGQFDAIFGNHVHVPQPIEKVGNTWVAYGSGNYISNQTPECCAPLSPVGLFPVLEVTLPADGGPAQTNMTWTAHTTDTDGGHRVHPLPQLAAGQRPDGLTLAEGQIQARWEGLLEVMGGEALLRTEPYTPTGPAPTPLPRPR